MLTSIDKKTLTYILYNGNQNYEYFIHLKEIIQQNPLLRNDLELYSLPYKQRIAYEFRNIREIVRLFKEKILTIHHMKFLPYFIQYSHPFDVHFGLFRSIIETYGSLKQIEQILKQTDELKILGSVLLSEINLFNNQRIHEIQDVTTRAIYDERKKTFILKNDESNSKLCNYFSYYSTHVIVFARLFINENNYGVFPFLVNFRTSDKLEVSENISVKWLGKILGERTKRQYLIRFDNFEIPYSSLIFEDEIPKITEGIMKKSVLNFKVVKLLQLFEECKISIADLHKAVYIVSKYNSFRSQFSTLEESKEERKILYYQNNSNKIIKALCESFIFKIGFNNLENKQNMTLSNISKNAQKIEYFQLFLSAIRTYLFKNNFASIQNLRENCGGYGFLQYSGVPFIQENAFLNVSIESNYQDNLANFALIILKKYGNPENCENFNNFYFPMLYSHQKLDVAFDEIENLPSKSIDSFFYLGRLLNLKCAIMKSKLHQKLSKADDELNAKLQIYNDPLLYEEIIEFAEAMIDYYFTTYTIGFIVNVIYRPINNLISLLISSFLINRLLSNYLILSEMFKGNNLKETVTSMNEQLQKFYEIILNSYLMETLESFEFDENSLNCILEGDRDQFYGKLFDTMKNKNKRNDPATIKEIVTPLIKFLNRPNL